MKYIFTIAFFLLSLNASMSSSFQGENSSEDLYKNKERGIIATKDVDGDGILDVYDKCLDSKPCEKIGKDGCAIVEKKVVKVVKKQRVDLDKDGVFDDEDQCLGTPKGFNVDSQGCSVTVNLDVLFDTGKYNIKENYTKKLKLFIEFMKKHPKYSALIEGHTDNVGTEKNNQILSQNRANSVKNYIIEKGGIDSSRIRAIGFGEIRPLNDNSTKELRKINRRVIAVLEK